MTQVLDLVVTLDVIIVVVVLVVLALFVLLVVIIVTRTDQMEEVRLRIVQLADLATSDSGGTLSHNSGRVFG